jgi:hypothetical protein
MTTTRTDGAERRHEDRHCEESSDEAIQHAALWSSGLLRCARNDDLEPWR